jgi:hypothetical protein
MPKAPTLRFLVVLAAVAVPLTAFLGACQVYDFEPVTPLSLGQTSQVTVLAVTPFKPNLLLMVDKSGSMDFPLDPNVIGALPDGGTGLACDTAPGGTSCGQDKSYPCDVTTCPTRWSTLTSTVTAFLTPPAPDAGAPAARFGLAFFPQPPDSDVNNQCAPLTAVQAPIPASADDTVASLDALANASIDALATVTSANPQGPTGTGGGTPTGGSFKYFNTNPSAVVDPVRDAYILLLTDGLPNCNYLLASEVGTSQCICTLTDDQDCIDARPEGIGCLDNVATVAVITELKSVHNITTVVLGFGADAEAAAAGDTLQQMAIAGAFPTRLCPNKTQACSATNPCNLSTGACSKQYFDATDAPTLAAALAQIYAGIGAKACIVPLQEAPSNAALISVLVNGTAVLSSTTTWEYQAAGTLPPNLAPNPDGPSLQFFGDLCTQIQASSKADPLQLQIRILTQL